MTAPTATPMAEVFPFPEALTAAEARVRQTVEGDGVHVVHFWAPWCPNSRHEIEAFWPAAVEAHPDVSFTFVTVWNDGVSARDYLDRHGVPARVEEVTPTGDGSHEDPAGRRKVFLGLPMPWVPSTWGFHKNGQVAFAVNYGELDGPTFETLLGLTGRTW